MTVKKFLHRYSILPPVLFLSTNLIVSFITRPFIDSGRIHNIVTGFDKTLPFIPEFIYIYVLAFLQWAICVIGLMILNREKSWYYCTAVAIGNLISGVIFLVFPTMMTVRPEFSGGGAFTELIGKFIFSADTPPMNIFPSIHCLNSWVCIRIVCSSKRVPLGIKILNAMFSAGVFLSVLFVKQHLIFDVPAGILIMELSLLITRVSGIDKKLSNLESKILLEKPKEETPDLIYK